MIYFDNASTSIFKPKQVSERISSYLTNGAFSPTRSDHSFSRKIFSEIELCRKELSALLGVESARNIFFSQNATGSSNQILKGLLKQDDHVIVCSFSHNAVLRPLFQMEREGKITVSILDVPLNSNLSIELIDKMVTPKTRLVCVNHTSNVTGATQKLYPWLKIASKYRFHTFLDVSQSLDYSGTDELVSAFDFIIGTGHKGLLGPPGVGFGYVRYPEKVEHTLVGGHGSDLSYSPYPTDKWPEKFEAGTINSVSILGLLASIQYGKTISKSSYLSVYNCVKLASHGISKYESVEIYSSENESSHILSFNVFGVHPKEFAHQLNHSGYAVRAGIHCAPEMHRNLDTLPHGTVRISFGISNSEDEVVKFLGDFGKILSSKNLTRVNI